MIADAADRYVAEAGRRWGLAAEGLTAVCGALRNGEVETLLIGDLEAATVVDGGASAR
ncbi:hypothetical protein [Gordonia sp. SL306]|uniref:hypothetical protein n=1 Tax=Gordonia sp. SL306 TaxID=2995145 RepID=UPI0022717B0D|nr:hypothetical protein [Gordonia sp. SL306]WAC55552.1 hypothetical protein OVA31_23725 [Gordonia sp. SL306]